MFTKCLNISEGETMSLGQLQRMELLFDAQVGWTKDYTVAIHRKLKSDPSVTTSNPNSQR